MTDRRYFAYAETDRAHGHLIDAVSFEDAAAAFAEKYHPAVDADDAVRVHVRGESGVEHCFTIQVGGEMAPCR